MQEDGNIVYLKKGRKFQPQVVTTGPENDDYVVIVDGLAEGDEVSLVDPTEQQSEMSSARTEKVGSGI